MESTHLFVKGALVKGLEFICNYSLQILLFPFLEIINIIHVPPQIYILAMTNYVILNLSTTI